MARVVAVRTGKTPFAVSLALLRDKKTLTDQGVTLNWQAGQASAIDTREIAEGRDVGTVSAAISDGKGGQQPVPYDVTFAFVFHAFHPKIAIRTK